MRGTLLTVFVTVLTLIPPSTEVVRAQRLTSHPAFDYHPKWSPDGETILFTSRREGRTGIWMVPAQGGTPVPLHTGMDGDHHISWSPDGTEIAFDAHGPDGRPNIWILTVETGEIRPALPATNRGPNYHPTWSPDGTRMAFMSFRSGNSEIWIHSLEDGSLRQITDYGASSEHPWFAPDGRTVAFDSDRSGYYDIWLIDVDSGTLVQVTDDRRREVHPCVSPDGQLIAFSREEGDVDRVWIQSLDTGEALPVPTGPGCGWPTWSPDGGRLACATRDEGSPDILVVDVSEIVETLSGREPS